MTAGKDRLTGFSLSKPVPSNGHRDKERWGWRPNMWEEDPRQDYKTISTWMLTREIKRGDLSTIRKTSKMWLSNDTLTTITTAMCGGSRLWAQHSQNCLSGQESVGPAGPTKWDVVSKPRTDYNNNRTMFYTSSKIILFSCTSSIQHDIRHGVDT